MPDPQTPSKNLTQPTVGADNNAWGGLLNTNLALIDSALGGTLSLSISGNTTLNSTQAQNGGYEFTGSLSGTATLTWPAFSGFAVIQNGTTGGHSIICGISAGTVTVLNGETVAIWSDGTNFARLAQVGGGAGTTGTGSVVLATSPTLATPTATTSLTTPQVLGGTTGASQLTLQSTTGAFDGDGDAINFVTATGKALSIISNGAGVGGVSLNLFAGGNTGPQNVEFNAVTTSDIHGAGVSFRATAVSAGDPPRVFAIHSDFGGFQPASIWLYEQGSETHAIGIVAPAAGLMHGGYQIQLPANIDTNVIGGVLAVTASDGGSYVTTAWEFIDGNNVKIKMANGSGITDQNGIPLLAFDVASSAVNFAILSNASTGNPPFLTASGSDTNIDLAFSGVGTGGVGIYTNTGTTQVAAFKGLASGQPLLRIHQPGTLTTHAFQVVGDQAGSAANFWTNNANAGTPSSTFITFSNSSGGTTVGSVSYNGTNTVYGTTSDQRLKVDKGIATDIGVLERIKIHDFVWRSNGAPGLGVFAQEAWEIKPSAVTPGDDGEEVQEPWQVDNSDFVPNLVVGWQNHQGRITALEAEIAELKRSATRGKRKEI